MSEGEITQAGRDWLLHEIRSGGNPQYKDRLIKAVEAMPLIPDPLESERKKWGPRTNGGHEYEIFAMRGDLMFGIYKDNTGYCWATAWNLQGQNEKTLGASLIPINPHAEDAAWLREQARLCENDDDLERSPRFRKIAEALEGK